MGGYPFPLIPMVSLIVKAVCYGTQLATPHPSSFGLPIFLFTDKAVWGIIISSTYDCIASCILSPLL